jgi:methionine synthase II (cobalamin-independent)
MAYSKSVGLVRAQHIGSLARPTNLLAARMGFMKGEISAEDLEKIIKEAILSAVKLQTELHFQEITDGEYRYLLSVSSTFFIRIRLLTLLYFCRRTKFYEGFLESLAGMKKIDNADIGLFRPYDRAVEGCLMAKMPIDTVICTGKVRHTGNSYYLPGFEYLKSTVPDSKWKNLKHTMVAPAWFHPRHQEETSYPKSIYNSDTEYFDDLAEAYATEVKILYSAGLRHLQIDDPNFVCKKTFCLHPNIFKSLWVY